jgi:hypothetical protein
VHRQTHPIDSAPLVDVVSELRVGRQVIQLFALQRFDKVLVAAGTVAVGMVDVLQINRRVEHFDRRLQPVGRIAPQHRQTVSTRPDRTPRHGNGPVVSVVHARVHCTPRLAARGLPLLHSPPDTHTLTQRVSERRGLTIKEGGGKRKERGCGTIFAVRRLPSGGVAVSGSF